MQKYLDSQEMKNEKLPQEDHYNFMKKKLFDVKWKLKGIKL